MVYIEILHINSFKKRQTKSYLTCFCFAALLHGYIYLADIIDVLTGDKEKLTLH